VTKESLSIHNETQIIVQYRIMNDMSATEQYSSKKLVM